jgi:hypothetical protein
MNQKKSLRNPRKTTKHLHQDLQAVTLDPDMKENQALGISHLVPPSNLVLNQIADQVDHLDQAQEDTKVEDLLDHLALNLLVK